MCSIQVPELDELSMMTPAEIETELRQLDAARRDAEAAVALMVHRVDKLHTFLVDGHHSIKAWGRATCNWSGPEAARLTKVSRLLARFPSAAGIGVAQLHALANVAANPRVHAFLDDAEELLVGQAANLDFDDYALFLAYWVATVDPDGAHADHERAHRDRRVSTFQIGNKTFLNAQLGAAQAAQFRDVHDAFTQAEFHADWEQGLAEHGERMCKRLMARTEQQRRADALITMANDAADNRRKGVGETVTNIIITKEKLEHTVESALGGNPEPLDPTIEHRCETANGVLLDPHDVLVATTLGYIRRVVVDSAGVIIDVGRKQRLFTGPLREIILALGRRCFWPGCHIPARHCQTDHVLPYAHNGPTAAWNGAPDCAHHNRWRTRGYTTWRDEHGHWHHQRPDGTQIGWRAA